jgi:anti-sigma factor RsiW
MCELSSKLIAWMDGELGQAEAAAIEQHLADCAECRNAFASYGEASEAFALYRDAAAAEVFDGRLNQPLQRWLLSAVGTAAAIALLLFFAPKHLFSPVGKNPGTEIGPSSAFLTAPPVAGSERSVSGSGRTQASHQLAGKPASTQKARAWTRASAKRALARSAEKAPSESVVALAASPEPLIEVVLPADGMFPPGAMPQGMSYVANVTVAAGTEPLGAPARLAGFERRNTQP